jgi:hypothetical protein
MPYASAGVRELWFGALSAAAVPGMRRGKAARGRRGHSPSGCCAGLLGARARRWQGTFVGLEPPPPAPST